MADDIDINMNVNNNDNLPPDEAPGITHPNQQFMNPIQQSHGGMSVAYINIYIYITHNVRG